MGCQGARVVTCSLLCAIRFGAIYWNLGTLQQGARNGPCSLAPTAPGHAPHLRGATVLRPYADPCRTTLETQNRSRPPRLKSSIYESPEIVTHIRAGVPRFCGRMQTRAERLSNTKPLPPTTSQIVNRQSSIVIRQSSSTLPIPLLLILPRLPLLTRPLLVHLIATCTVRT